MHKETIPTIAELYPDLTEQELKEADTKLEQYLLLVLQIYERLSVDPESYARFCALTAKTGTLSCTRPRSKPLSAIQDNNEP
jgi:hypothetical protein